MQQFGKGRFVQKFISPALEDINHSFGRGHVYAPPIFCFIQRLRLAVALKIPPLKADGNGLVDLLSHGLALCRSGCLAYLRRKTKISVYFRLPGWILDGKPLPSADKKIGSSPAQLRGSPVPDMSDAQCFKG
jgi:hypothetical protein